METVNNRGVTTRRTLASTNSLRKSTGTSFHLNKSASMELPYTTNYNSPPHEIITTSSTIHETNPPITRSFHYPTSPPPPQQDDQSIHSSPHHQHPLTKVSLSELFTCSGCKEFGAGNRFSCQQCDFQLHAFCAFPRSSLQNHPLHGQHQLIFHSKSKPGGILWPKCDVCGKATKGFTFRCSVSACSFQMHPCCAMLTNPVSFPDLHQHSLKLLPITTTVSSSSSSSSSSNGGDPTAAGFASCGECKRKRSGRLYRCTVCDYHLHAVCAKNMINGLEANGIKGGGPEKPNKLGSAARVASIVLVQFINGLVGGLGEGFGQALVQDITRGGRRRRI